jgi:RNA polymerase sigma-70 factor, ECF subfamily
MSRDPLARPDELIRRIYSYVAYRIGPGSDAEDVTSEAMLRAVRYRSSYDPKRGKPLSWLIGIARTCIVEHHTGRPLPTDEVHEHASTEDLAHEVTERLTVVDAVARLEPKDRELVALRYGADLSTRQIAQLLETTPNAVDVALHRCRARLKAELEGTSGPSARQRVVARAQVEPSS